MGRPRKSELEKYKLHYETHEHKSPLEELLRAVARGRKPKLAKVRIPR